MADAAFDYIVVGAGSAGAVIAARLSEDPGVTVLLVEAGSGRRSWKSDMPSALAYAINDPSLNWAYQTEPEPHLGGRRIGQPRGKAMGGSSAINGMRLCDSFMCATFTVSGSPDSVIVSWLQSNWYASPGAKLIGT